MFTPNKPLLKDYSANRPTLPAIGSNFAASGPYSGYFLLGTVKADQGRQSVTVNNPQASANVALVLDDGSTAVGSVPPAGKASVIVLPQAGVKDASGNLLSVWTDNFQGRIQIFAASASANVAVWAR